MILLDYLTKNTPGNGNIMNKMKLHIHIWKYYDNGLTRKCRCGAIDHTVGETPSMSRLPGDKWVRLKK